MQITYRFIFSDRREEVIDLRFDPATMAYLPEPGAPPPEWARLESNQCRSCPLKAADQPSCPVAANLAPVLSRFADSISFEEVDVAVTTGAREYRKRTSLQRGLSGVVGLIMATSGCPVLDKLRPMAFNHLPLAELGETRYRAISMYLFAQLFRESKGLSADWDLSGLERIYRSVQDVNQDFIKRLRLLDMQDANYNALAGLDCFCIGDDELMTHSLMKLERIFQAYLTN